MKLELCELEVCDFNYGAGCVRARSAVEGDNPGLDDVLVMDPEVVHRKVIQLRPFDSAVLKHKEPTLLLEYDILRL